MKKTIQLGGEDRAVNFGTLFLYTYQERHNENPLEKLNECISKIPKDLASDEDAGLAFLRAFDFKFYMNVLSCALEAGAEAAGEPVPNISRATLSEWVDEAGGIEFLGSILSMMFEALPNGKPEQKRSATGATVPSKKKR